jgi:hypothetical protein
MLSSARLKRIVAGFDLAYSARLAPAVFLAMSAVSIAAAWLPASWRSTLGPASGFGTSASWFAHRFAWDFRYYDDIAAHGYHLAPPYGMLVDAAFWPLWPIILHSAHAAAPTAALFHLLLIIVSFVLATGSAVAFHALAADVLPRAAARRATILYLVYPGAHFLLRAYPTALSNLFACVVLLLLRRNRIAVAASLAGLAVAAGPLAVAGSLTVTAVTLIDQLAALKQRATVPGAACRIAITSLAAFWGLLAYSAFLGIRFGQPFAFVAAEQAWAVARSPGARVKGALLAVLILPDLFDIFHHAGRLFHGTADRFAIALDRRLNAAWLAAALTGLAGGVRHIAWPIMLHAALIIGLYVWFIDTVQGHEATLRLLYQAPGSFIGLAWLLQGRPVTFASAAGLSAISLAIEVVLTTTGYYIV